MLAIQLIVVDSKREIKQVIVDWGEHERECWQQV
jgi:hypothetical protein